MRNGSLRSAAAFVAVILTLSSPAMAHKLKVFAAVEGSAITGYAYFSPGGRAQEATVTVTAQDGSVLATSRTGNDGSFQFEATRRIDTTITVDGGDGHVASYTVTAIDLPESLGVAPGIAMSPPPHAATPTAGPKPTGASPAGAATDDARLRDLIEQSVARQVRPLREEIDAYQEKIWAHDVMGGLGVIAGLGGLAFGLSQRGRRNTDTQHATLPAARKAAA